MKKYLFTIILFTIIIATESHAEELVKKSSINVKKTTKNKGMLKPNNKTNKSAYLKSLIKKDKINKQIIIK